ncbi:protealysin inhibitor emfourin [Cognatiyoonia koreensis]|nr:protealysin inhibitor emfourin [Cognatiyoonia koreensis]
MMIEISTSGGFGGLQAAGMTKLATVEDLPQPEHDRICAAFAPSALAEIAGKAPPAGRADTITYDITVTDDSGAHHFKLDETQIPPTMLDMIDALPRKR